MILCNEEKHVCGYMLFKYPQCGQYEPLTSPSFGVVYTYACAPSFNSTVPQLLFLHNIP